MGVIDAIDQVDEFLAKLAAAPVLKHLLVVIKGVGTSGGVGHALRGSYDGVAVAESIAIAVRVAAAVLVVAEGGSDLLA